MFNELLESVGSKKKTNKSWAVVVSGLVQSGSLIVLILIPLIYTQALPKPVFSTILIAPAPPPPSPPPPNQILRKRAERPVRLLDHGILHTPRWIPIRVALIVEPPLSPESPAIAITSGSPGGDLVRDFGGPSTPATPPPPPVSNVPTRIKLGGVIQAAKIVSQPSPIYPVLAHQAGIQGSVLLHAVLDKDGRVSELQVISGHPLLVQAALNAVKQWRYQPTLLNNEPVEVDTTITVTFVLGG